MKMKPGFYIVLIVLTVMTGCAGKKVTPDTQNLKKLFSSSLSERQIKKSLLKEYKRWKGTPHVMGGNTKKGVDCSGFVHQIYKKVLNMKVPRSTKLLMKTGIKIKKNQLKPGDMVLFKPPTYPAHVGVYVGDNRFIHTSKSKGVTMTDLNNTYWKKCYYASRRIFRIKP